jgi:uncharacterized protein YndB with AHSA1/START domain
MTAEARTMRTARDLPFTPEEVYAAFASPEAGRTVVIRHDCAPYFTLTVRLAPAEGGTRLTWEQVFDDATFAANVRHIVVPANEQNIDRMTRALARA